MRVLVREPCRYGVTQSLARSSRRKARGIILVEHDFVDVTPAPILARLEGSDDRVLRRVKMLRSVAIFRRIAATDVSADQTQAKVHPSVARQEAFLAAFAAGCDFLNFFNVRAAFVQGSTSARILRQSAEKNRV